MHILRKKNMLTKLFPNVQYVTLKTLRPRNKFELGMCQIAKLQGNR